MNGNAPRGQLVRHHICSAHFFKAQLGVGVQVPPNSGHAWSFLDDGFDQLHIDGLCVTLLYPPAVVRNESGLIGVGLLP